MKKSKWLILVAVFFIALFVPIFPVEVVPEWSFRLVYEDGQPVPNARVDQTWKHYSLELWSSRHTDQVTSDVNGMVTFPARSIRASAFQFVAACIRSVLMRMF